MKKENDDSNARDLRQSKEAGYWTAPNTADWIPRSARDSMASLMERSCRRSERLILAELENEKDVAVDNFDAGLPFENVIRFELQKFLPERYSVKTAHVLDRFGKTAGKCDIVIKNDIWFPDLRLPYAGHGIPHVAIESVYSIGEIKNTLNDNSLQSAMQKIVMCHRLHRPNTYANRIVENRDGSSCNHGLTNPLFSFILAGRVESEQEFQSLVFKFFITCQTLKRLEVVRALCVLGMGTVTWGYYSPSEPGVIRPALFVRDDLFHPIFPVFLPDSEGSAFSTLIGSLQKAMYHSVLAPEDLEVAYGRQSTGIKASPNMQLAPDPEWKHLLEFPCQHE